MKNSKCFTLSLIIYKEVQGYFKLKDILCKEDVDWEVYLQICCVKLFHLETGKKVLQSDLGKDILNDTISSAATAATTALLENNPNEAKTMLLDSFKRSGHKSKDVVKKIAKDKLDQVLTGRGVKKRKYKKVQHQRRQKKHKTLLDM